MTNDKQRERLVELIEDAVGEGWRTMCEAIADNLIIEGGIIVPPCKVGDTVYRISTRPHSRMKYVQETTISRIAIDNEGTWLFCTCNPIAKCVFGKTVFFTKEEAEAKIRKGQNDAR